jgi:hypothetical protein
MVSFYSGSHKYVPIDTSLWAAKGFAERRPAAIYCSTTCKATKGIGGQSEASLLAAYHFWTFWSNTVPAAECDFENRYKRRMRAGNQKKLAGVS